MWFSKLLIALAVLITFSCGTSQPAPSFAEAACHGAEVCPVLDRIAAQSFDSEDQLSPGFTLRMRLIQSLAAELAGVGRDNRIEEAERLSKKYQLIEDQIKTEDATTWSESALVYHPLEAAEVQKVRSEFGGLTLKESDLGTWTKVESTRPWAGYWYPMRSTDLFSGSSSPMAKFDRILIAKGRAGGAAAWESDLHQSMPADSWEGLCDAWAKASISVAEPTKSIVFLGVEFEVKDQKALLLKSYQRSEAKRYGVRYQGNAATDGTYQDIRPESFHRLFTSLLGESKRAFYIDDDAGVQVWSKPVFSVRWKAELDPSVPNALLVKAAVDMVSERSTPDNRPTSIDDTVRMIYDYRLFYSRSGNGALDVLAGEWIGNSVNIHPDFVETLTPQTGLQAANPVIGENMDVVKSIFGL